MKPIEIIVWKRAEYRWPLVKGNKKEMVSVKFWYECRHNTCAFNEQVMTLREWNKSAELHNERMGRKRRK